MFLKDKSFHVSEVYLKKESRIEALSMIMVLCLFLYSIAQWKLRCELKEMNKFVRNQVKKPTQSPTMKWVFFLFRGITELTISLDGNVEKRVANMTDELWDILSLMGKECEKYYVWWKTCGKCVITVTFFIKIICYSDNNRILLKKSGFQDNYPLISSLGIIF